MPNTFLGITTGSNLYLTNQLNINLVLWLDEAFLNAGMFRRVAGSGESNYAGNILTELKAVSDHRYPSGTYWEARTNNWCYESGLAIQGGLTAPFRPSGVYLRVPGGDYIYYPSGSANGSYNYTMDFKEGAVRFLAENIVPPESTLLCPHSYKEVHVDIAGNDRFDTLVFSDTKSSALGSGTAFPTRGETQLPAVFIEHNDRRWKPLELGGNKIAIDSWTIHVFAENQSDRDQLTDMLDSMESKQIKLANFNTAAFPLNDSGDINPAYPNLDTLQLTDFYRNCYIKEATSHKFKSVAGFHRAEVNYEMEIYAFN